MRVCEFVWGVSISIHALLAESDMFIFCSMMSTNIISIHALLAESDVGLPVAGRIAHRISIHALLAESDHGFLRGLPKEHLFLSTLSLRRATVWLIIVNVPE